MKKRAKSKRPASKPPRRIEFQFHVTPILGAAGLILGFLAEIIWQGTMLWMTAGGLLGGVGGALCDVALYLYRKHRRESEIRRLGGEPKRHLF